VRWPLILGSARSFGAVARVQFLGQRPQTLAQAFEFLVLAIHHIAELSIGSLQKRELQFKAFNDVFIHGLGMITRKRQQHAQSAALAIAQPQTAAMRLGDLATQRKAEAGAGVLGGIKRQQRL